MSDTFDPISLTIDVKTVLSNCNNLIASASNFKQSLLPVYRKELVDLQQKLQECALKYENGIKQIKAQMNYYKQNENQQNLTKSLNLPKTQEKNLSSRNKNQAKTQQNVKQQNGRNYQQSMENKRVDQPLDVWQYVEPFYADLPKKEEIGNLAKRLENHEVYEKRDWRKMLEPCYDKLKKEFMSKKKRTAPAQIPGPPPPPTEILNYWKENKTPFQMEPQQKQMASTINYVLSAFVEASKIDRNNMNEILGNDDDKIEDPLYYHVLPPNLPINDYLSYPFDERLEFELQAIGLQKPDDDQSNDNLPFANDIVELEKSINKSQEKVDQIRDFIFANLDNYYEREKNRKANERNFYNLMNS